jgi:hypothetical protein
MDASGDKANIKPDEHIWAIRQQLRASGRHRDLAMFNCAIDSKLRACALVRLRASDVAPGGRQIVRWSRRAAATWLFMAYDGHLKEALDPLSNIALRLSLRAVEVKIAGFKLRNFAQAFRV